MIVSSVYLERSRLDRSVPMERDAVEEARCHQAGQTMREGARLSVALMLTLLDRGIGKTDMSIDEMTLGFADSCSCKQKMHTISLVLCGCSRLGSVSKG